MPRTVPRQITTVRYQEIKLMLQIIKLSSLQFENRVIIKIIGSRDTSKAHGHDDVVPRNLGLLCNVVPGPL